MSLTSIRFFFFLAAVGSFAALLSLFTPWMPWASNNQGAISTAGSIAGGVAAAFGLAVAAIALRAYVYSESTERKDIDSVWDSVSKLQKEFAFFASANTIVTSEHQLCEGAERSDEIKSILRCELTKGLHKVITEQCTPEFLEFIKNHKGEEYYRAFLGFRIGLTLSAAEGWNLNSMIQEHLNLSLQSVQDIGFRDIKIDLKR